MLVESPSAYKNDWLKIIFQSQYNSTNAGNVRIGDYGQNRVRHGWSIWVTRFLSCWVFKNLPLSKLFLFFFLSLVKYKYFYKTKRKRTCVNYYWIFYSLWCLFNYYSKCIKLLKITELQVEKKIITWIINVLKLKKGMSNSKVIYNIIKSVALVILTEMINLS